jgi:hypothetical protein
MYAMPFCVCLIVVAGMRVHYLVRKYPSGEGYARDENLRLSQLFLSSIIIANTAVVFGLVLLMSALRKCA